MAWALTQSLRVIWRDSGICRARHQGFGWTGHGTGSNTPGPRAVHLPLSRRHWFFAATARESSDCGKRARRYDGRRGGGEVRLCKVGRRKFTRAAAAEFDGRACCEPKGRKRRGGDVCARWPVTGRDRKCLHFGLLEYGDSIPVSGYAGCTKRRTGLQREGAAGLHQCAVAELEGLRKAQSAQRALSRLFLHERGNGFSGEHGGL